MSGFVRLDRDAFDHHIIGGDPARFYAWFWMIAKACWKPTRFNVHGKTVTLNRGQFCCSIRELADAWGWKKSATERFITRLKTETMIETDSGTGRLIITICNYEKYQSSGDESGTGSETPVGTAAGQQRDIKEQGNKGTIDIVDSPLPPADDDEPADPAPSPTRDDGWPEIPDWVPVEPWNAFLAMRNEKGAWPTAHAVELLIKKLNKLRRSGCDPGAVLNESTMNNWTGIFELKGRRNGTGSQHQPARNGDGAIAHLTRRVEANRAAQSARADRRPDAGSTGCAGELPLAPFGSD